MKAILFSGVARRDEVRVENLLHRAIRRQRAAEHAHHDESHAVTSLQHFECSVFRVGRVPRPGIPQEQVEHRREDEGEKGDGAAADEVENGAKVGHRLSEEEHEGHDGRAEEDELGVDC